MRTRNRPKHRSGVITIAMLVCFGVVALILLAVVKHSLSERRQLKRELQMQQTQNLADAGVAMAIRGLEKIEPDVWKQVAVELDGYDTSGVKYRVGENGELEVVATIGTENRPAEKTTFAVKLQAQEWKPETENKDESKTR